MLKKLNSHDFYRDEKELKEKLKKFVIPANQNLKYIDRFNIALNTKAAANPTKLFSIEKHEKTLNQKIR